MDMIVREARAKINLGLDVCRKRPDGYHEVNMVMQSIDLCDTVTLAKTACAGIALDMEFPGAASDAASDEASCSGTTGAVSADLLPGDPEKNLAWRAAKILADEFGLSEGLSINIKKRIPVAAGLAGGSTDAAAVLSGMNELFGLGIDEEGLRARGLALGADVPYCLMGGTALARGVGEILTPLPPAPAAHVLIAKPREGISTALAYARLDEPAVAGRLRHPDIAGLAAAIEGGDLEQMCALMGNVFEDAVFPERPEIAAIKQAMLDGGALGALMSGSGPTVFGIFADEAAARICRRTLAEGAYCEGLYTCVTRFAR